MLYQFKKMLFKSDNDFVLWEVSGNGKHITQILSDNKLRLTVPVMGSTTKRGATIDEFLEHHLFSPGAYEGMNAKKTIWFLGDIPRHVWLGKWQHEHVQRIQEYAMKKTSSLRKF